MIRRYVFGEMIETEAILAKPEKTRGGMPFFAVDEKSMTFSCTMEETDRVYGLGEM